ncbi:MAG TPA: hypothetical protein VFU22_25740 [Roseiflexaceae bacterium]|nr:hypothetical protein [Roseiflexaceae bacterium]
MPGADTGWPQPNLIIIPTHSHSAYQFDYLQPFLTDGLLDAAERAALQAYEATVFDTPGDLRREALPRYQAPLAGSLVGTIISAMLVPLHQQIISTNASG